MVSEKGLTQFRKLYKKEYGIELSDQELEEAANALLRLYRSIYRPSNLISINKQHEKLQHKNNKS